MVWSYGEVPLLYLRTFICTIFSSWLHDFYCSRMKQSKDFHDDIDFQTAYLVDIANEANYGYDLDTAQQFHDRGHHKKEDILKYRDKSHASKFTGTKSPIHHCTFMEAHDDSKVTFLKTKPWRTTGSVHSSKLVWKLLRWFLHLIRKKKCQGL